MPETTKQKNQSADGNQSSASLNSQLHIIREEKRTEEKRTEEKRLSNWHKIKNFIKKTFSRDKDSTVGEEGIKDQSPRAEAISRFTDESGRVRGSIEEHRAEEQRIVAERERSGRANATNEEEQRKGELRRRAIAELEEEHIYVKGGQQAIQAKMAEIEARDKANSENSGSTEKV